MIRLFTTCIFIGLTLPTLAQVTASSQTGGSDLPGVQYALALYDSATVESQHLYNGQQYYIYDSKSDEHQFYLSEQWMPGTVVYDGQLFRSVPMLYDIVKDEVAVKYVQSFGNVALQSQKVHSFSLADHTFVRLIAGQPEAGGLRTGFYDVLYDGTTKLLARRKKDRLQQITDTRIVIEFPEKDAFYIFKNGEYNPVHSKSSILFLLEDQKKPLKKYTRQHRLSFRENREAAITALASHYDQLTKP